MSSKSLAALLAAVGMSALLAAGCRLKVPESRHDAAVDGGTRPDAAVPRDAAQSDGRAPDAAIPDAAVPDAAIPDAAIPDAAIPDAGPPPHVCSPQPPQDCSAGTGTGDADQCFDGPSCFISSVQGAVNGTISAHPECFQWDDQIPCWIVLDIDCFMNGVVASLQSGGLCAIRDPNAPGEEITVKRNNLFSENFDIYSSAGCARSGTATYTGYCVPAWW